MIIVSARSARLGREVYLGTAGVCALTFALTLLATRAPLMAAVALGGLAALLVSARWPETALVAGVVLTLCGGEQAALGSFGGFLLAGAAFVSALAILRRGTLAPAAAILLPVLILIWLIARLALGSNLGVVVDVLKCAAGVVIVLDCVQRGRGLIRPMAWAGAVFVALSLAFGGHDAIGTRFIGISGNANRLVFGLLVFLPFLLTLLARSHRYPARLVGLVASGISVVLIVAAGSAQGIIGLLIVAAALLMAGASRWPRGPRTVTVTLTVILLALAIPPLAARVSSSSDLTSLSGRVPLYSAALREIGNNPWIGSGLEHVSAGAVLDRSAHSALLSIAATGGVPVGLAWLALLVILAVVGLRLTGSAQILGAVPLVFIAEQFVQSVELSPLTWVVVAMFLLPRPPARPHRGGGAIDTERKTIRGT